MKAPNVTWTALFLMVVALAEYLFGQETVATQGAGVAAVLTVILRMWQEREAADYHTMTRGVVNPKPTYWRRVVLG